MLAVLGDIVIAVSVFSELLELAETPHPVLATMSESGRRRNKACNQQQR